jgi:hypothetical protein
MTELQNQLNRLIDLGLTFADCVKMFHAGQTAKLNAYAEAARNDERVGGDLELDDGPIVSKSDDSIDKGAFVMTWLWIPDSALEN